MSGDRRTLAAELAELEAEGRLSVRVGTSTFNFRRVTETDDLIGAIQDSVQHKLKRNQWTTNDQLRWLVVVLDNGEPATQLAGAFEFQDQVPDLKAVEFPGIDEVWVIASDGDSVPVLRLIGDGTRWSYCADVLAHRPHWIRSPATSA